MHLLKKNYPQLKIPPEKHGVQEDDTETKRAAMCQLTL